METVSGYRVERQVSSSPRFNIYQVIRERDQQRFLAKRQHADWSELDHQLLLRREYEVLAELPIPGVAQVTGLEHLSSGYWLLMQPFAGEPLNRVCSGPVNLEAFLRLVIWLVDTVEKCHVQGVIHRNICPSSIWTDADLSEFQLFGFHLASRLRSERNLSLDLHYFPEDPAFMSPEQTGRVTSTVDLRSDFYAIGAVCYWLLTGNAPFQATDPLEIAYAHIARDPKPVHEANNKIPMVLSRIVGKLLAKQPGERYQSGYGLKRDLMRCHEVLQETGTIGLFPIGSEDVSESFTLPEKLYGRDRELAQLQETLDHDVAKARRMILVSGQAGVGKTSLVWEIHKMQIAAKGYFIMGKYDQRRDSFPYLGLIQAFQMMIRYILASDRSQRQTFRTAILDAVGGHGQLLIDVIPMLELLIGVQPSVPTLPPQDAANRFAMVFAKFVHLFATRQRPLIVFLDDMQWADDSTLTLIEFLLTESSNENIFFICSYRDQEVDKDHPFGHSLERIAEQGVVLETIKLEPLNEESVNLFLSETFAVTPEETKPLAHLCFQKSQGNAFFLRQLLLSFVGSGLISFAPAQGRWRWSLTGIERARVTDNVAELMVKTMVELDRSSRQLLKIASCIGNRFQVYTLALVNDSAGEETLSQLFKAEKKGLIVAEGSANVPVGEVDEIAGTTFRFSHDRIQQAAHSLLDDKERAEIHLALARALIKAKGEDDLGELLVACAGHLRQSGHLIDQDEERRMAIRILLAAGLKIKRSAAFQSALSLLKVAVELVQPQDWEDLSEPLNRMHIEAAEAAYLSKQHAEALIWTETVLNHSDDFTLREQVFEIRLLGHLVNHDWAASVKAGLEGLADLGLDIQMEPNPEELQAVMGETHAALETMGFESMSSLKMAEDPRVLGQIRLMNYLHTSSWVISANLFLLINARAVGIILKEGISQEAPNILAGYCLVLAGSGELEKAEKLGDVAIDIANRMDSPRELARVVYTLHCMVYHWRHPLAHSLEPFMESYRRSLDSGDFEFASYSIFTYLHYALFANRFSLSEMDLEFKRMHEPLVQMRMDSICYYASSDHQLVDNLMFEGSNDYQVSGSYFNREVMHTLYVDRDDRIGLAYLNINEMIFAVIMSRYDAAAASAEKARSFSDVSQPILNTSHLIFFESLAFLRVGSQQSDWEVKLALVDENVTRLAGWAEEAPANVAARHQIILAERARVLGKFMEAHSHYDRAMSLASHYGMALEQALGPELAGRAWLAEGNRALAGMLLSRAHFHYRRWGALVKVRSLEEEFGNLLQPGMISESAKPALGGDLDALSVLKASQAISGEIVLENLIRRMLTIAMENAGARRGFLLMREAETWVVTAEGELDKVTVSLEQASPMKERTDLATRVCAYVGQSGESVILEEGDVMPVNDPYLINQRPKSLMCTPILHKGSITTLLYLENDLRTGVFTGRRLQLLQMLTSQAAISLENARLYRDLEERVAEQTGQVRRQNELIFSSMRYAKRIQNAILTDTDYFNTDWMDLFHIFLPKDLVSGDFFWLSRVKGFTFVAVVDCTGHGVPGAFMSMIGNTLLNQIVNELGILDPAQILTNLDSRVRHALRMGQQGAQSSDGMDLVICRIHDSERQVVFAGARRPLFFIRNQEIQRIRGSRKSIGDSRRGRGVRFENHHLDVQPGDGLYLLTDGLTDQHNLKGKRFGTPRLTRLLKEIGDHDTVSQKQAILQRLVAYQGAQEQRDDITLVGIRFSDPQNE